MDGGFFGVPQDPRAWFGSVVTKCEPQRTVVASLSRSMDTDIRRVRAAPESRSVAAGGLQPEGT